MWSMQAADKLFNLVGYVLHILVTDPEYRYHRPFMTVQNCELVPRKLLSSCTFPTPYGLDLES